MSPSALKLPCFKEYQYLPVSKNRGKILFQRSEFTCVFRDILPSSKTIEEVKVSKDHSEQKIPVRLSESRFRLDINKKFLIMRMVRT